ncbi:MAG TPA: TolC family protein, partial [Bdellovibrionales bacterium]|nr:TolC family protein [Bdellovibrionales bacterium]
GSEKNQPTLDVYAQLARNALTADQSEAISKSTDPAHQGTTVGVRFNMPVDIGAWSDVKSGYEQQAAAAELRWQRRLFEQEKERKDLRFRVTETKKRLKLAQQLEAATKAKYDYERERHGRGRTTTFMVLQFEQELALAQLNRLRIQTEMLSLISQMKLYAGAKQ